MTKKKIKEEKIKTNRASKGLIISIIIGIILLGGGTTFILYNNHLHEQERIRLEEEQRRKEEEHKQLIEHTKEDFSFYLINKPNENLDSSYEVFNQVIEENTKNENIDYNKFLKSNMKNIDLSKLSKTIETIDTEIKNYQPESLNFEFNTDDLNTDYDKVTLKEIFNSHELIKDKDQAIEKRNEYLKKLENLKTDIEEINNQSKQFYKSGNKYLAKSDTTVKNLKNFSDKYKLNLTIEKEFLVPILCYHGVLDNPWGISSLFVRVKEFETQMQYLHDAGYTPIFASEIASAKNFEKPVIITFDDGYKDVYTNAFPILKKYNLKANVYMISDWIGGDAYMDTDMTKEMSDSLLIEIGSHTVDHKGLASLSSEEIEYELKTSKEHLETMINKPVTVIAYPKGSYDNRVVNTTKKYYTYGLSTNNGKENPDRLNKYTLNRIYVYRGTGLDAFKNLLQ